MSATRPTYRKDTLRWLTCCTLALSLGCAEPTTMASGDVTRKPSLTDIRSAADPVIVAAGDLVCGSATETSRPCVHAQVAALIPTINPAAVLLLGDIQYEVGSLADFNAFFHPAFGAYVPISYPMLGNHEYGTPAAQGYFDYFNGVGVANGRGGPRGKGYYSFNLGAWHIVVLNSNCTEIACGAGSLQEQWLRADLAANPAMCTLAAWHHPRFSSGPHGPTATMQAIWQALYDADADLVLSGHDHIYERFAPQTASGAPDNVRGLRQFVVGTGGKDLRRIRAVQPNSEVRHVASNGWLTLTLRSAAYDWSFAPTAGGTLNDAGSTACHGGGTPPPPPVALTIPVAADAYVASHRSTLNRGTVPEIAVDSSPAFRTYLRFSVSGVGTRQIISAKLRLYGIDPSPTGGAVHALADNTWGETTLTYANAPAYNAAAVATFGAVTSNAWFEVDVTGTINGDGTFSFVLDSPSTDAALYRSREGGPTTAPHLVLTVQ